MAYLLPHLSPSLLISSSSKSKPNSIPSKPIHFNLSSSSSSTTSTLSSLQSSTLQGVEVNHQTSAAQDSHQQDPQRQRGDFYLNLGLAVRTLREDLPLLFSKDLNYDIYRDDITFVDPLNTFTGIDNYKLIFWGLRFHGRILFREICLEVFRVWQPSENVILIRWNLKGVPRVPWEAKGEFQGTSRYKLDRNGKIYQHKVDNLAFNFPQPLKPAASVLDLVTAACPASPNPTFLWNSSADSYSSSWVELYRAVRETLDRQEHIPLAQDGLITCS